ncbi:MAG: Nif3-like dinuclear metal center hexameric protein [Clostridia bacterium]|nr:Nif3-like dinuclear metal center hexameric protein [Clostridia bacterium]
MLKTDEFFKILDARAPIELSYKCIANGEYDNSGLLIKCADIVERVAFSLDLSVKSVEFASRKKCDLMVTHHPAIYHAVKSLSTDDPATAPVISAIKRGISVISMHLNLDVAKEGIDFYLSKALGAGEFKILDALDGGGYGREFFTEGSLSEFVRNAGKELKTDKILFYGKGKDPVGKVASFCGGGYSFAEKAVAGGITDAHTIVTSDVPHHVVKEMCDAGKNLVVIPHYAAEEYGFGKFFEAIKGDIKDGAELFYFRDDRLA